MSGSVHRTGKMSAFELQRERPRSGHVDLQENQFFELLRNDMRVIVEHVFSVSHSDVRCVSLVVFRRNRRRGLQKNCCISASFSSFVSDCLE